MIYLDHGATSFPKPPRVIRAVERALRTCANPGRGGYGAAMAAAETVYRCRERAAALFSCLPEQVVMTGSCTQGLNMAIRTLVRPGAAVITTGFEHNAVSRTLRGLQARQRIAGRRLFDWDDTLEELEKALRAGADAAVFTHVSNVFGYVLPIEQMGKLCREAGVPFILDAAQSGGHLPLSFAGLGAEYIALPGHKGLLGPQGTGLLLCSRMPRPLIRGGTGTDSVLQEMPEALPEGAEPGTLNVPGIAGLSEGLALVSARGTAAIGRRERLLAERCAESLEAMGMEVFRGRHQAGVVSFRPGMDCQEAADRMPGIALRAGLHCAPQAHESAGTLETGTLRVSFGWNSDGEELARFLQAASKLPPRGN